MEKRQKEIKINPRLLNDAVRKQKNLFRESFQLSHERRRFSLLQFRKFHPSEILKFNHSGISQSLKLRILVRKKNPFNLS